MNRDYGPRALAGTVLRNWSTLLCFEMFYRGVGFVILSPLLRYLLGLLPGLAGEAYLGQGNILSIFNHPPAILLLLGILLLAGFFVYFEIVALFLYSERSWRREYCSVWGLWKETTAKAAGLFLPKRLLIFLLLPVMMFSLFSITSGYLQDVRIPEFIMEFLEENPLLFGVFVGVVILFHLIIFFYLFGLPALLFEGKSFIGSWKESKRLLYKRKIRIIGKFAAYWLMYLITIAILTAIGLFLLVGGVRLFSNPAVARGQFQLFFISLQGIWGIVTGAVTSVFLCSVIVVCYHQGRGDPRPLVERRPRTKRRVAARVVVVIGTLLFLALFSETEIGGRVWYPVDLPTKVVAHRAGAAFGPENTVAALRQAAEDGAYMAEIDVQQLKDGTLIVLHDTNFKRTTGRDLDVWDADYETVKGLDAGSSYSPEFTGEPVPTLEDMLRAAKDNIHLMVELKANGHEESLVENTLDLIEEYGMKEQCMIASMDVDILSQVKKMAPDMKTVYISVLLFLEDYSLDDIDAYSVETTALTTELAVKAHFHGKQVYAWTANSEETIDKILRCGADGLVTDNPLLANYCISEANENFLMTELSDIFFPEGEDLEPEALLQNA